MSLVETIDPATFSPDTPEDDVNDVFEDLVPVMSPSSSTRPTIPVTGEPFTSQGYPVTSPASLTTRPVTGQLATSQGDAPRTLPKRKRTPMTKREKREKNNEACRKSRAKKNENFQTLQLRVAELEKENRELTRKLQSAYNEITALRYG